MTGFSRDLRIAVRQLLRRPVWLVSVVLVLALGIGANVAMFSGFDAWVLRPLDFPEPERLVALGEAQPSLGRDWLPASAANLQDWQAGQRSFESAGAFVRHVYNLNDPVDPARLQGARVSASLFPTLGKSPVRGRGFTPQEDAPGQPAQVVLISDRLWRARFAADPGVVGRTLRLDGRVHEVAGIMEPGFLFPEWADVWTPLGADPSQARDQRHLSVIARLQPQATLAGAREELAAIAGQLETVHPGTNEGYAAVARPLRRSFVPEVIETALRASLGAGLFVLLIICANVASLMLARARARRRETAIRAALGAGRGRLVWQSLLEGLLVALPAGLVGIALSVVWQRAMVGWVPVEPPYLFTLSFSPRVGLYTLLVSVLAGVACGLAPLLRGTTEGLVEALKEGGAVAGEGRAARWARQALVAGELALSTALVAAALLMAKSFLALQDVDRGHRTRGVVTATLSAEPLQGDGDLDRRVASAHRLLATLEETAGLETVGLTTSLPVSGWYSSWGVVAHGESQRSEDAVRATVHAIAGGYRKALEIPLVAGREFDEAEAREGAAVALVSQGLARALWGEADPLGRRLRSREGEPEAWLTVVGVLGGVDYGRDMLSFGAIPEEQIYVPYGRLPGESLTVAAYSPLPAAEIVPILRSAFVRGAPGTPFSEILTLDQAIFRERWVSAFFSRLLGLYAVAATLIAAVGLFGLTAETTSRRTRELALRIALGARRRTLLGMIVGEALRLGGAGVALGLLLSIAVSRFGASMLHLVEAHDPLVLGTVGLSLLGVSVLAAALPAWRASNPDASLLLHCE